MPQSNSDHMSTVLHYVQALNPGCVLDVGIGNGSYGFLIRQYLDIAAERIRPEQWQARIDGMDMFEGYHNPIWNYAYNHVYIGDMRQLIDEVGSYDLILFNDVLEHVERDEAQVLIIKALQKSKAIIATTPNWQMPQGSWGGNEAETHRSFLNAADFKDLVVQEFTGATDCYICSSDHETTMLLREALKKSLSGNPIRTCLRKIKRRFRH